MNQTVLRVFEFRQTAKIAVVPTNETGREGAKLALSLSNQKLSDKPSRLGGTEFQNPGELLFRNRGHTQARLFDERHGFRH